MKPEWLKIAGVILAALAALMIELYTVVTRPLEHQLEDIRTEIHGTAR